jgi:hypothetical protein
MPRGTSSAAARGEPGERLWRTLLVLSAVLSSGCTQLLGIDGTYELGAEGGSSGNGEGGSPAAGSGGVPGSGGTVGSSGSTATGGDATGGHATGGHATGGTTPDSGSGCRPGHYTGSIDGLHRPLVTIVGVGVTVQTGAVSFALGGSGDVLEVEAGMLEATLTNPLVASAGSLTATLRGKFDCASRRIDGRLSGGIAILGLPSTIDGTWAGGMDATGAFTGTWTISESLSGGSADSGAGGACVLGGTIIDQPVGTGCGTWSAE